METIVEKLKEMKEVIGKEMQKVVEPVVNDICKELMQFCDNEHKVLQKEIEEIREREKEKEGIYQSNKVVITKQENRVDVEIFGSVISLQHSHFKKLQDMYMNWLTVCSEKRFKRTEFYDRLACMLLRYQAFAGAEGNILVLTLHVKDYLTNCN